jgi:hypothetical protein
MSQTGILSFVQAADGEPASALRTKIPSITLGSA